MTLETLATIRNPPAIFAHQANINNSGQQQVNNGATVTAPGPQRARAANPPAAPTELFERSDGQRMDAGAAGSAVSGDPQLAAVGARNRPEDC